LRLENTSLGLRRLCVPRGRRSGRPRSLPLNCRRRLTGLAGPDFFILFLFWFFKNILWILNLAKLLPLSQNIRPCLLFLVALDRLFYSKIYENIKTIMIYLKYIWWKNMS
jgi:hypothetical protein